MTETTCPVTDVRGDVKRKTAMPASSCPETAAPHAQAAAMENMNMANSVMTEIMSSETDVPDIAKWRPATRVSF